MPIFVLSTPFKNDPKWCSPLKESGAVVAAKLLLVEEEEEDDDDANELDDVAESRDVAFTVVVVADDESLAFICDVKFLLINNETPLSSIVSDIDWMNLCISLSVCFCLKFLLILIFLKLYWFQINERTS